MAALLLAVLKEVTVLQTLCYRRPRCPSLCFVSMLSTLFSAVTYKCVSCAGRDKHNPLHLHSQL